MKWCSVCLMLMGYSIIFSQNPVVHDWTLNFPPVFNYNNLYIVDVGKDNAGNIYLTGFLEDNIMDNADIITFKIMSNWIVGWVNFYNGAQNKDDIPMDLEIDNEGNCYVAGRGFESNQNDLDFILVKYNSCGEREWTTTYNGAANGNDWINKVSLDNLGNAYVTGTSFEESQFYGNAITIKYDSIGSMEWKATLDGPTIHGGGGQGIVVDNAGNVYVAGYAYINSDEFLTIKYNSEGVKQWTKLAYQTNQNEWAQFIGLDNFGRITVGGTAYSGDNPLFYIIVKYNPDGSIVNGVKIGNNSPEMIGMTLSSQGNVYVTGYSYKDRCHVTMKLSSSGNFQWERNYNGGSYAVPYDIKIDSNENIYITGYSSIPRNATTVKYDSSGTQLWVNSYNSASGRFITLDDSGDLYVAVGSSRGNEWIKLNNNGVYQWTYNYKNLSQPTSIKEDSGGNIYITGFGGFNQSMWDYITMKCDSSGKIIWIRTYNGPANETDQANDIELDDQGNVYVTGGSKGIGNDFDFATIKYDSSGNEQWVVRYNAPAFYSDIAGHVSVDPDGNVYVSGSSLGANTSYDIATVKYNNLGQFQWVKRYNSTANGNDLSQGLEVDISGNIFVVGNSDSTGSLYDYVTIKYNPSGNTEWIKRYNGPANDGDLVSSMSLDNSGNVYVSGWSFGNGTQSDYATVKYNNSGVEQWAARWDDPASSYDYANDIAVDENGNVYVTGISQGMGTDNDYTTVKYNSMGEQQWAVPYNGQSNGSDIPYHIALDYLGDIYVTVYSNNNAEYSTIKYNKQGVQQWEINYDYLNYQDTPTDLLVDNSGNVVVAGYSSQAGEEWIWSIVKYKQPGFLPSDVETETTPPTEFVLYQNYPNPFNPSTKISWQSPVSGHQVLRVFDVLGNVVAILADEFRPAGTYEEEFIAKNLSSGVYFYTMQAGEFMQTKKLILMK